MPASGELLPFLSPVTIAGEEVSVPVLAFVRRPLYYQLLGVSS